MKTMGVFVLLAATLALLWALAAGVTLMGGSLPGPWQADDAPPVPGGRFVPAIHGLDEIRRAKLSLTLGDPATSGQAAWPGPFDSIPKAYDFDGDGVDELVALSNDTNVYVFSTTTGRVLAKLPTQTPPGWYIERVLNGVEAGVLTPGEPPSLVVTNHAAYVTVWRFVPGSSDGSQFTFQKAWERRMVDCFWNSGMDAKPTLADVDHNGTLEILVQTEETGLFALNPDGTLRWYHCWGGGNSEPVVADLGQDGDVDVIFASDAGEVVVLNGADGKPQWSFNAASPAYGISPASIPVSPTVAELDGLPGLEVLFIARHAPNNDSTQFPTFHMAVFAVHQSHVTWKTELLWMRQPVWAHPLSYTHLLVTDVDNDTQPDILGMDWNTVGHQPGNWELLPGAHMFRLNATGQDVWTRTVETWWSNKDVALGDPNGDGQPEVFLNGVHQGADGIWVVSAADGSLRGFVSAAPWKIMRGPLLDDLGRDGIPELIFPVEPDEKAPTRGGILIFTLGQPRNPVN